jgi:hypothetical protein
MRKALDPFHDLSRPVGKSDAGGEEELAPVEEACDVGRLGNVHPADLVAQAPLSPASTSGSPAASSGSARIRATVGTTDRSIDTAEESLRYLEETIQLEGPAATATRSALSSATSSATASTR